MHYAGRIELVFKELNHLEAILHAYARGLIFMKLKKWFYYHFSKRQVTFKLIIIIIGKSLQKEQIAQITYYEV